MTLLIDIGNSRIKSAWRDADGLHPLPAINTSDADAVARVLEQARARGRPTQALVSCVADDGIATRLHDALRQTFAITADIVRPRARCGEFSTRYNQPAQLGVDRWLVALAAWRRERRAVCVIDMGTALTADVVNDQGEHLGGLIAPGLSLMADSLLRGTAHLQPDGFDVRSTLATNTRDAIALGCSSAVAGLLQRLADTLAADPGTKDARWFVTGGGGAAVAALLNRPFEHAPQLVLEGLLEARSAA